MRRRKAAKESRGHTGVCPVWRAAPRLWDATSHGKGSCLCPEDIQGELLRLLALSAPVNAQCVMKGEEKSHLGNVIYPPR